MAKPSARQPATAGGVDGTQTAAQAHGWGQPTRDEEFTTDLSGWSPYDGPGHAGNGRRTPSAATVSSGALTIKDDANGNSEGMAWNPGVKYGRWEARVRAPVADTDYHAVLLLWPDSEKWPDDGEVDFMENSDPTRQRTEYAAAVARAAAVADLAVTWRTTVAATITTPTPAMPPEHCPHLRRPNGVVGGCAGAVCPARPINPLSEADDRRLRCHGCTRAPLLITRTQRAPLAILGR